MADEMLLNISSGWCNVDLLFTRLMQCWAYISSGWWNANSDSLRLKIINQYVKIINQYVKIINQYVKIWWNSALHFLRQSQESSLKGWWNIRQHFIRLNYYLICQDLTSTHDLWLEGQGSKVRGQRSRVKGQGSKVKGQRSRSKVNEPF